MAFELQPSIIRYSQSSIKNRFSDNDGGLTLEETVQNIMAGCLRVESFPLIHVKQIDGNWFSSDNRRLWVFKQLESHKFLSKITALQVQHIPCRKFTTKNGGLSIRIRKDKSFSDGGYMPNDDAMNHLVCVLDEFVLPLRALLKGYMPNDDAMNHLIWVLDEALLSLRTYFMEMFTAMEEV